MEETGKGVEKVIDLEQDADGVYKPKAVRHISKSKGQEEVVDIVLIEARQSKNPKVQEFLEGWDMGMSIINHLLKHVK